MPAPTDWTGSLAGTRGGNGYVEQLGHREYRCTTPTSSSTTLGLRRRRVRRRPHRAVHDGRARLARGLSPLLLRRGDRTAPDRRPAGQDQRRRLAVAGHRQQLGVVHPDRVARRRPRPTSGSGYRGTSRSGSLELRRDGSYRYQGRHPDDGWTGHVVRDLQVRRRRARSSWSSGTAAETSGTRSSSTSGDDDGHRRLARPRHPPPALPVPAGASADLRPRQRRSSETRDTLREYPGPVPPLTTQELACSGVGETPSRR